MNYNRNPRRPYSDELCHHGIKGQKWGVRRYQNLDGSLTALGKIHYGAANVAKATGRAISNGVKETGKYISRKFKERHPKYMSDDELRAYVNRLDMEKKVKDLRKNARVMNHGRKFVGDALEQGGKTLANAAFQRVASKISRTKDNTFTDWKEVLNHPEEYSDAEVAAAKVRSENLKKLKKNYGVIYLGYTDD